MSELINKVVTKHEIRGEVQITKVYPELENLTVTPTKEIQSFNHPDSYGYNNVVVKAIDCETLNVVPKKENQAFDGMYDKVNINAIDCETLNIKPKQESQAFDGMYDKVRVDAIVGDTLEVTPKKTSQSFTGLYDQVNVAAIQADTLNIQPTKETQTFKGLYETVNVEKVSGDTIDITPKETAQTFNGLYEKINVEAIGTEEVTINPDFSTQDAAVVTATDGKYIKKATINKDAYLVPENILAGVSVYGVNGAASYGIDTSDATATAGDILKDKTAYVNGEKITGTFEVSSGDYNAKVIAGSIMKYMIKEVDLTGISLSITSAGFCNDLRSLTKVKGLDMTNSNTLYTGFTDCSQLQELDISNTQNVTNFQQTFYKNTSLTTLPQLQGDKAIMVAQTFYNCSNLKNWGGFLNLGKAYTQKTANYSNYTLDVSKCPLTYDSLMNVVNGLYDLNLTYNVANGGTLYSQTLKLGSGNQTRLSSTGIAIATAKGWNVS